MHKNILQDENLQQIYNEEQQPQVGASDWDEFDKIHPMNHRADNDDTKNSIDNPENVDNLVKDATKNLSEKKPIPNQIQEINTQTSFKVIKTFVALSPIAFLSFPFV